MGGGAFRKFDFPQWPDDDAGGGVFCPSGGPNANALSYRSKGEMMTPQKTQKLLVGIICVLLLLLAFGLGFLLNRPPLPAHPEAGGEPEFTLPLASATNVNAPAPPIAPAFLGTLTAADFVDWVPLRSGGTVEQTGTNFHIFGTNSQNGWRYSNGVVSNTEFPVQDFEIATDFMMPQFDGPGDAEVVLQADNSKDHMAVVYDPVTKNYYVHQWSQKKGEADTSSLPAFGDETTTFHRMRLKYEAATHLSTGWIDDNLIGTHNFELTGSLRIIMGVRCDKKGNKIDLTYDHFAISIGGKTIVPDGLGKLP